VETYHTFFEEYLFHYVPLVPKAWMRAAARRLSRAQCNDVDAVVVPSTAMRDVLVQYGIGSRMDIIPTEMELDRFQGGDGARFRQRHGIASDRPVLLHVGRVAFEKNIEFLLSVVERVRRTVPHVLFIIAGEGPARRSLELKAKQLGLANNTRFIGYMDREHELLDCYRAANCKVFASRTETQGLVLLEAMALGVPVVSTAIMGTVDVLQPGSGAIVVEENADEFADATIRVLTDPSERAALSAAGLDYVRAWSSGELASRLVGVYGDLLAQGYAQRTTSVPA
jgi:glycosyltransferase involved in cell wall biosynthesis